MNRNDKSHKLLFDSYDEVSRLADACLRDEITDAELARLEELVLNDPAARRLFACYLQSSRSLHERAAVSEISDDSATSLPLHRRVSERIAAGIGLDRHPVRFWGVTAAMWIVFVGGFIFGIWSWRQAGVEPIAEKSAPTPGIDPIAEKSTPTQGIVARITGRHLCEWADPDESPAGDFLHEGTRLELTAGMLEITYDVGVRVVLEAPVVYTISGIQRGDLQQGQLLARVLQGGDGFVVDVPHATVTDKGTEFGVRVDGDTASEVYVFSGAVEVKTRGDQSEGQPAYRLEQGDSAKIDIQSRVIVNRRSEPPRFARSLPKTSVRHISVANPSFEFPALKSREAFRQEANGWEIASKAGGGGGVSTFGSTFAFGNPQGRQAAYLHNAAMSQELSEKLAAQTTYVLSIWAGNRPGPLKPDFKLELWAGDTLLASESNGVTPTEGRFEKVSLTFASGPAHPAVGKPMRIVLRANTGLDTKTQNHFDDVRLVATTYDVDATESPQPLD